MRMTSLNPQQQQAIAYTTGPLLVLAGAGSGKTRVITEKIVYLIQQQGYAANQIAAITFTNKAANEMRERAAALLPPAASRALIIATFHALGMRILRQECQALNLKADFSIFDASDAAALLAELLPNADKEVIWRIQKQISLWKNALLNAKEAAEMAQDASEALAAKIYQDYETTLNAYQAVDFDDLIYLPCRLFRQETAIKYRWQHRISHLLIDEYQDTNTAQYQLMRDLVGSEARFSAVGDDDQSIYAWRGADRENLARLAQDFPQLKVIKLEQNYRSAQRILRVANAVIAHNDRLYPKKLWSALGEGEKIYIISHRDEDHEAQNIVQKLQFAHLSHQARYADFAILYRGNHQARRFEEALRNARIPYRISGGQSFFDKAEIKDILAYLRVLANPDDDPAFIRAITTPKRGIGSSALDTLNQLAKQHQQSLYQVASHAAMRDCLPAAGKMALQHWLIQIDRIKQQLNSQSAGKLLRQWLIELDYENYLLKSEEGKKGSLRWRNVEDLIAWIERKHQEDGKNLIEIGQTLNLMGILEKNDDEDADVVRLSTLHAAKGLEFPYVYLVGCEEGLFPHSESTAEGRLEEERRLMYVGITRAKRELTLSYCIKRRKNGQWQFSEPSRFLAEMPADDIIRQGVNEKPAAISSREQGLAHLENIRNILKNKQPPSL